MAEQGISTPPNGVLKVWTFELISGPTFRLDLPHNPSLDFDGKHTIWKMVGTDKVADSVMMLMMGLGVILKVFVEEQTVEQKAERDALLGRGLR